MITSLLPTLKTDHWISANRVMIGAPKTEIFRPVSRLRSILIYRLESRIFLVLLSQVELCKKERSAVMDGLYNNTCQCACYIKYANYTKNIFIEYHIAYIIHFTYSHVLSSELFTWHTILLSSGTGIYIQRRLQCQPPSSLECVQKKNAPLFDLKVVQISIRCDAMFLHCREEKERKSNETLFTFVFCLGKYEITETPIEHVAYFCFDTYLQTKFPFYSND